MSLTAETFAEFQTALLDAFPVLVRFRPVAEDASQKSLDRLSIAEDLDTIVREVIRRADTDGWLPSLLREALKANPDSEPLKTVRDKWRVPGAAGVPANHFRALLLPGRRSLIDRKGMRDALEALTTARSRVVVINGGGESGKSYTIQFVGYLRERMATFRFAPVDLERVRKNNDDKVDSVTLGEAISDALFGGPPFKPPADHNRTTWIDSYCRWLGRNLPPGQTWWLVIDSFEKVKLDQTAKDLVTALASRTYVDLLDLRLVLLSFADVELLKARIVGALEYEEIEDIQPKHLFEFFARLSLEHHRSLGKSVDAAGEQQIRLAVARVLAEAASRTTRRLEAIGRIAWDEAESMLRSAAPPAVDELDALIQRAMHGPMAGAPAAPEEGGRQ